ncbi:hypothetical protein F2Q69_00033219 [Brassica cretica]|uniref:Uncharacterized protein n=1 Tax=Brassica cretica TaxID=69181 RepID=A0A8S9SKC6_BRACR|nr:hypothetical protein F2Q69_00033219 [Brassica cretica]
MPLVYCGLFDQYSRLQTPVARVIFNGAIRLLFPRRVSSRRRRWLLFPRRISSRRKIDGVGLDRRRFVFWKRRSGEGLVLLCRWFRRELFFIGLALLDGGVASSLHSCAGGRWRVLSLTRISER